MVLSPFCIDENIGVAQLVPLKSKISSFQELLIEARLLWKAEGGYQNRITGTQDSVGLLHNPNNNLPKSIVDQWKSFFNSQDKKLDFLRIKNDLPALSKNGMINIKWITDFTNRQYVDFDFILARATIPNIDDYPTANQIADACFKNNYSEYFQNNLCSGIFTFQDKDIQKHLVGLKINANQL